MDRGFQNPLTLPPVEFVPERYSFSAVGGPRSAVIKVGAAEERAMWELLEYLRCPIEIYDDREACVWWGYVSNVEINVGKMKVGVSLDTMFNNIAVIYTVNNAKAITAFEYDAVSVAIYGVKEFIATLSGANEQTALSYRSSLLDMSKYPTPTIDIAENTGLSATINCAGWFETLDWKYYSYTGSGDLSNKTQIENIVNTAGQFLTGIEWRGTINTPSSDPNRNGDTTALHNLLELLDAGSDNKRLLAYATRDRRLIVYPEPDPDPYRPEIYLLSDGTVQNVWGDPYYASACPAGVWARLKDVIPGSVDLGLIADPTMLFIEEADYDIENSRYLPTARLQKNPLSVGTRLRDG
jgi:hypothetical protein